ncbi:MAG: GatB/YqeY domain-containing protein [Anaerolineae bacterium]|nr:GatB/YqeY domain-containing protein [Anaerolineae bacterium]
MLEQLTQALQNAIRARDSRRKSVIRLALSAIKNAQIEKRGPLEQVDILALLQKEVKIRRETIEGAVLADRKDLIEEAEAEIAVLEEFLPRPLSRDQLEALVREAIQEVGAATPREMGAVMKILVPRTRGRADGKETSQLVRELLS